MKKIGRVLLCIIGLAVFLIILALPVLTDRFYGLAEAMLNFFVGEHHFSGENWFSALCTCVGAAVSALPGLICGIMALKQTQRLHDLEDRYHRPLLILNEAVLKVNNIKQSLNNLIGTEKDYEKMLWDNKKLWDIRILIKLESVNYIPVKYLSINEIKIKCANQEASCKLQEMPERYGYLNKFFPKYDNNKLTYIIERAVYPIKEQKNNFEDKIGSFMAYLEIPMKEYKAMEMTITFKIEYEYGNTKDSNLILHLQWQAEQNQEDSFFCENSSSIGYLTYD